VAIPLVMIAAASAIAGLPIEQAKQNLEDTLGLPSIPIPPDNLQTLDKIKLGRALFHDKRLSADGTVSCATCHRPELAHSDGRSVSEGSGAEKGARNAPSILNAAYLTSFFWDGRRKSLEEQAQDPFTNTVEHGLKDQNALLEQIRDQQEYRVAFHQAFGVDGGAISIDHVTKAIAAFERTLVAGNSPFDRYHYGGVKAALPESAIRGLSLFTGRAGCAKCHTIGPDSALFTDQEFHSLGVGLKLIEPRLAEIAKFAFEREDLAQPHGAVSPADIAELGRFVVTRKPTDIGKFRTPSLRNVAVTAPYMHDGSVSSLEAAVDLEVYYRGIESGRPLILTPQEKADLVSFLTALTSPQFQAAKGRASP
jgi:cytochrome c peroxidase